MLKNKDSVFMKEYRSQGIPATKVPDAVVQPMVENVMNMPDAMLMNVGDVVAHPYQQTAHSFDSFVCEECGEMVVEQFGRIKGDKKVCMSCLG
jgi:formylmethanofuran dehydrogenase subunit E